MLRVLIVVPYQELKYRLEETIGKSRIENDLVNITTTVGMDSEIIQSGKDYQIIIARGVTGQNMQQVFPGARLIEIPITTEDIITALLEYRKNFGTNEVALVLNKGNSCNVEKLEEISGVPLRVYYISGTDEASMVIEDVCKNGLMHIIGGFTICRICDQMGIETTPIYSTRVSIEQTVFSVYTLANELHNEKLKTDLLNVFLDNSKEAVLVFNSDGYISAMSHQTEQLLQLPYKRGIHIKEILDGVSSWKELLYYRNGEKTSSGITINGLKCKCNPIVVGNQVTGGWMIIEQAKKNNGTGNYLELKTQGKNNGLCANFYFSDIVTQSDNMNMLISKARKYSKVDSNVLIIGETGTGKELFAQSIHNESVRANYPFVAVNCAEIPEHLLESELFGYVNGAFSGAVRGGKIGLFELANKGTIFLDEIGELPIALQAKLLRVLQEQEIRRLGDNKIIKIDVRVISATNINLREKVSKGQFRSDLFYRINVLNLLIPPLRERKEDIGILFQYFVQIHVEAMRINAPDILIEAQNKISKYSWLGNVRELKNFAERVVVLSNGGKIDLDLVNECVEVDEVEQINEVGKITKSELAKELGISRTTLWRRSKK